MTPQTKAAQLFLQSLHEKTTQDTFDRINVLIEALETKEDPEMTEVRLADSIYNFLEQLRTLESNLQSYVAENRQKLPGNKLASLYEEDLTDIYDMYIS